MRDPQALMSTADLASLLRQPRLRVYDCTTYLETPPPGSDDPYIAVPGRRTFEEARAMVDAAAAAHRQLVVGPSHSFDAPIVRTRELIASGAFGAVRMIHAAYYTDFLYRPRRPAETRSP